MEMGIEKVVSRKRTVVDWERVLVPLMEAVVAETVLFTSKSVIWLLMAMGSLSNEMLVLPKEADANEGDAIALLRRSTSEVAPENKDDGETDDDDDDGEDEEVDEEDDDEGDDDLSGDDGSEGDDDPDDVEANGEGGSDDEDDDEDDEEDDDGEDEEDDEEDDEDEDESPQPPSKKRK